MLTTEGRPGAAGALGGGRLFAGLAFGPAGAAFDGSKSLQLITVNQERRTGTTRREETTLDRLVQRGTGHTQFFGSFGDQHVVLQHGGSVPDSPLRYQSSMWTLFAGNWYNVYALDNLLRGVGVSVLAVPLTRGAVALIDAEDWPLVAPHRWFYGHNGSGQTYAITFIRDAGRKRTVMMHRLIMGAPSDRLVDHINGDGLDNRRVNLRLATPGENLQNRRGAQRNSVTGIRGVCPRKNRDGYTVNIYVQGRRHSLGLFRNLADAEQAAIEGRRRLMTHSAENRAPVLEVPSETIALAPGPRRRESKQVKSRE